MVNELFDSFGGKGLIEPNRCAFIHAYSGQCKNYSFEKYCKKHIDVKCSVCNAQATHECPMGGYDVCCAPLCDDCKCGVNHGVL